ncbi:hypothetical protein LOD99_13635 [Oopsacas minuta]|uniref:Uncharacterized protein n=1 Tax=Oopsacas minuta TaxID=111878 RepID=A0AAV7KMC0_9METZ|nr:hypothetical protein LOD99_13635 [Oopsacas minuta]
MDNMLDVLSHDHRSTDTIPIGAPDCLCLDRKDPLFGAVHIGHHPHKIYSPGPISVCSRNNLIFIADDHSGRIKVYTEEAYFITYFKQTIPEQITNLLAYKDELFVLNKNRISIFIGLSCLVNNLLYTFLAVDISDDFVYIGTNNNIILMFGPRIDLIEQIGLSRSHLTDKNNLCDFKVIDDSLIYALFTQTTFPFQIFNTDGEFLICYSFLIITPLSLSISKYGYIAISDVTSNSVKILSPDFKLVHTIDDIFELRRAIFLENSLLVTNSSLDDFKLLFF